MVNIGWFVDEDEENAGAPPPSAIFFPRKRRTYCTSIMQSVCSVVQYTVAMHTTYCVYNNSTALYSYVVKKEVV